MIISVFVRNQWVFSVPLPALGGGISPHAAMQSIIRSVQPSITIGHLPHQNLQFVRQRAGHSSRGNAGNG